MIRAIASIADCERAALKLFGLGIVCFCVEQNSKLVKYSPSRLGDVSLVRCTRDRERVWRERVEGWPVPYVAGIADERRVDPFQRFAQDLRAALVAHRAAGEILDEAMHGESRLAAVLIRHARNERIGVEATARFIGVGIRRLAGDGDVEQ